MNKTQILSLGVGLAAMAAIFTAPAAMAHGGWGGSSVSVSIGVPVYAEPYSYNPAPYGYVAYSTGYYQPYYYAPAPGYYYQPYYGHSRQNYWRGHHKRTHWDRDGRHHHRR